MKNKLIKVGGMILGVKSGKHKSGLYPIHDLKRCDDLSPKQYSNDRLKGSLILFSRIRYDLEEVVLLIPEIGIKATYARFLSERFEIID